MEISNCKEMDDDEKKEGYEKYEVDSACDCLIRAESIRKDPKMMELVKPILEAKMGAMKKILSIDDIRKAGKQKKMEEA